MREHSHRPAVLMMRTPRFPFSHIHDASVVVLMANASGGHSHASRCPDGGGGANDGGGGGGSGDGGGGDGGPGGGGGGGGGGGAGDGGPALHAMHCPVLFPHESPPLQHQ
jgi:hypothetical protein